MELSKVKDIPNLKWIKRRTIRNMEVTNNITKAINLCRQSNRNKTMRCTWILLTNSEIWLRRTVKAIPSLSPLCLTETIPNKKSLEYHQIIIKRMDRYYVNSQDSKPMGRNIEMKIWDLLDLQSMVWINFRYHNSKAILLL